MSSPGSFSWISGVAQDEDRLTLISDNLQYFLSRMCKAVCVEQRVTHAILIFDYTVGIFLSVVWIELHPFIHPS